MAGFEVFMNGRFSGVHRGQGDIEAVRPYLTSGKLLVVLDSKGNVIWHEKAGMSEQQVMTQMAELIQSESK